MAGSTGHSFAQGLCRPQDGTGRRASAYQRIKDAILARTLRPLERITEADVAARLGLSRTPVREAFGLLAAEGLITVIPQRGSFVSQLRIDDILEIYQIRTPLECMAARVAAETIDDTKLAVLDRLVDVEAAGQGTRSARESLDANAEFHRIIIECVRNLRLQALIGQLQGTGAPGATALAIHAAAPGRDLEGACGVGRGAPSARSRPGATGHADASGTGSSQHPRPNAAGHTVNLAAAKAEVASRVAQRRRMSP